MVKRDENECKKKEKVKITCNITQKLCIFASE